MHSEILTSGQQKLLPYIAKFKRTFYLVGGTAIALYLGHRESIDYDLFTYNKINKSRIKQQLLAFPFRQQLAFHKDIDYSENVKYIPGFEVNNESIKQFLIDVSIKI